MVELGSFRAGELGSIMGAGRLALFEITETFPYIQPPRARLITRSGDFRAIPGNRRVVAGRSCSNGCRANIGAAGASAMRGGRFGAIRGDFVRLFQGDSVAGLGEG